MRYGTKAFMATGLATLTAGGIGYGGTMWGNSIDAERVSSLQAQPEHVQERAAESSLDTSPNPRDPLTVALFAAGTIFVAGGTISYACYPREGTSEAGAV